MEVKRKISLLSITKDPGELIEDVASISYRTQRFYEKKRPKIIKFKSGRTIPFSELGLSEDPAIGVMLPGYKKDDVVVTDILPPSWVKVVKFLLTIGHHSLFRMCHACFLIENITRKGSLHFLRYKHCNMNFQSQKYKDQGDFEYLLPGEHESTFAERLKLKSYMGALQNMYNSLKRTTLDAEWMRSCYPNNIAQTMVLETNFEQLRHLFDCLCGDSYVGENQEVAMDMLRIMKKKAPVFFYDFVISEDGKSAKRKRFDKARNKQVNWTIPTTNKVSKVKIDIETAISKIPGTNKIFTDVGGDEE